MTIRGAVSRYLRANALGLVAIFLVLTGGTALATHPGGANTVSTEDVINGQILTQDIGTGQVMNSDIAPNSVPSSKIVDDAVQGADVAADTLTGADVSNASTLSGLEINEAGLARVPNATSAFNVLGNAVRQFTVAANNGGSVSGGGGFGGLGFGIRCSTAGQPPGDLDVTLSTETDNSTLAVSDDDSYADIEDFDVADSPVDLQTLLGADSDEIINLVYREGNGSGQNRVVSGMLHILDEAPDGDTTECQLAGHLTWGPEP